MSGTGIRAYEAGSYSVETWTEHINRKVPVVLNIYF